MIKKLYLFISLILLTACATPYASYKWQSPIPFNKYKIPAEFQPHIKDFVKTSNGKIKLREVMTIQFKFKKYPSGSSTLGTCYPAVVKRWITINQKWWKTATYKSQRELIFHELGHCLLNRRHTMPTRFPKEWLDKLENWLFKIGLWTTRSYLKDHCPSSIMHLYALSRYCIQKHGDYYDKELFNPNEYEKYKNKIKIDIITTPYINVPHYLDDSSSEFEYPNTLYYPIY